MAVVDGDGDTVTMETETLPPVFEGVAPRVPALLDTLAVTTTVEGAAYVELELGGSILDTTVDEADESTFVDVAVATLCGR